jgi:MFS family permease
MRTNTLEIPTAWEEPPRSRVSSFLKDRLDLLLAGPREAAEAGTVRTSRKLLWVEGLLTNASESFAGAFLAPFALALGVPIAQIGWLASTMNIACAAGLLPGAKVEERYGCRKHIYLLCTGVFGRLFLLGLVFLPLLFNTAPLIFYGLLAVVMARGFLNQFSYPAWSALVTDLVPEKIRGRYFGSRNMAISLAALICTPLGGYIIKEAGPGGYTISFLIALAAGFAATLAFGLIRDPGKPRVCRETRKQAIGLISVFTRYPRFAALTGIGFLLHMSFQLSGPFAAVYQIQQFGANTVHIGILTSISALAAMAGQRVWGVQNDRRGDIWVGRLTHFLVPATSLIWAIAPSWSYLPAVEAVSGFAWAGYFLSNFNLLVRMAPAENRARFVAVYQSAVAISSFLGPILGGMLVGIVSLSGLFWITAVGLLIDAVLFACLIKQNPQKRACTSL